MTATTTTMLLISLQAPSSPSPSTVIARKQTHGAQKQSSQASTTSTTKKKKLQPGSCTLPPFTAACVLSVSRLVLIFSSSQKTKEMSKSAHRLPYLVEHLLHKKKKAIEQSKDMQKHKTNNNNNNKKGGQEHTFRTCISQGLALAPTRVHEDHWSIELKENHRKEKGIYALRMPRKKEG